jgi:hypothetical protein
MEKLILLLWLGLAAVPAAAVQPTEQNIYDNMRSVGCFVTKDLFSPDFKRAIEPYLSANVPVYYSEVRYPVGLVTLGQKLLRHPNAILFTCQEPNSETLTKDSFGDAQLDIRVIAKVRNNGWDTVVYEVMSTNGAQ